MNVFIIVPWISIVNLGFPQFLCFPQMGFLSFPILGETYFANPGRNSCDIVFF